MIATTVIAHVITSALSMCTEIAIEGGWVETLDVVTDVTFEDELPLTLDDTLRTPLRTETLMSPLRTSCHDP